jgi:hypothetical protein
MKNPDPVSSGPGVVGVGWLLAHVFHEKLVISSGFFA